MAQEINVAVIKKQLTTKLKTLEDAVKAYETAQKKYDADRKEYEAKYEKDLKAWNTKVAKALIKSANAEDITLELRGYHNNFAGVSVMLRNVDLSAFGEQPSWNRWDYKNEEYKKVTELFRAIPVYYDNYHREVNREAVKSHIKKSLELLEVLPSGTATITVKDFNFITKF
jgi:hypothetical protein